MQQISHDDFSTSEFPYLSFKSIFIILFIFWYFNSHFISEKLRLVMQGLIVGEFLMLVNWDMSCLFLSIKLSMSLTGIPFFFFFRFLCILFLLLS